MTNSMYQQASGDMQGDINPNQQSSRYRTDSANKPVTLKKRAQPGQSQDGGKARSYALPSLYQQNDAFSSNYKSYHGLG